MRLSEAVCELPPQSETRPAGIHAPTSRRLFVRRSFAAMAMMALVPLVACGDDPEAPEGAAPAGFRAFRNAEVGFSVAAPSDWTEIPLDEDLDKFNIDANRIRLANPRLASAIVAARLLQQNGTGKLVVVRPDGMAKLNLTFDRAKEKKLDEVAKASTEGLLGVGATDMKASQLSLDGRPAIRLTFRLAVQMDEGPVTQDEYLYIVQRGRDALLLNVIGTDAALAETIAASLRIR